MGTDDRHISFDTSCLSQLNVLAAVSFKYFRVFDLRPLPQDTLHSLHSEYFDTAQAANYWRSKNVIGLQRIQNASIRSCYDPEQHAYALTRLVNSQRTWLRRLSLLWFYRNKILVWGWSSSNVTAPKEQFLYRFRRKTAISDHLDTSEWCDKYVRVARFLGCVTEIIFRMH